MAIKCNICDNDAEVKIRLVEDDDIISVTTTIMNWQLCEKCKASLLAWIVEGDFAR